MTAGLPRHSYIEIHAPDGSKIPVRLVLLHDPSMDNDRSTLVLMTDDQRLALQSACLRERQRILNGPWWDTAFGRIALTLLGGCGMLTFLLQIYIVLRGFK